MAFTNCYDVKASGLKVMAPQNSPNTDGIHISSSKHVQVIDSEIGTGMYVTSLLYAKSIYYSTLVYAFFFSISVVFI